MIISGLFALYKFCVDIIVKSLLTGTSKNIWINGKKVNILSLISESETYSFIKHRLKYFKHLFLEIVMNMAYR